MGLSKKNSFFFTLKEKKEEEAFILGGGWWHVLLNPALSSGQISVSWEVSLKYRREIQDNQGHVENLCLEKTNNQVKKKKKTEKSI